jgi:hypothetical protein
MITGPLRTSWYGQVEFKQHGHDSMKNAPNATKFTDNGLPNYNFDFKYQEIENMSCYINGKDSSAVECRGAVPIHYRCYEIFQEALDLRTNSETEVDIHRLFSACTQLVNYPTAAGPRVGNGLDIDYYELEANQYGWQFFSLHIGLEPFIMDPLGCNSALLDWIDNNALLEVLDELPVPRKPLSPISQNNPFNNLSLDILWMIAGYVSAKDLRSFLMISKETQILCDISIFWRKRVRQDLPWAWALNPCLREFHNSSIDWHCVYCLLSNHSYPGLWLPSDSSRRFRWESNSGNIGLTADDINKLTPNSKSDRLVPSLLGLANQRRIWMICDYVAIYYLTIVIPHQHTDMYFKETPEDYYPKKMGRKVDDLC